MLCPSFPSTPSTSPAPHPVCCLKISLISLTDVPICCSLRTHALSSSTLYSTGLDFSKCLAPKIKSTMAIIKKGTAMNHTLCLSHHDTVDDGSDCCITGNCGCILAGTGPLAAAVQLFWKEGFCIIVRQACSSTQFRVCCPFWHAFQGVHIHDSSQAAHDCTSILVNFCRLHRLRSVHDLDCCKVALQ